jgi:hypothetical protein
VKENELLRKDAKEKKIKVDMKRKVFETPLLTDSCKCYVSQYLKYGL